MKNKIIALFTMSVLFFTPLSEIIGISTLNTLSAQTDAITRYFDKYLESEDFTVVYITPKMFQMIARLDLKDKDAQDIKDVLKDLKGLRILQTEVNAQQHYKEVMAQFTAAEYELLMTVRDKGENVRFWTKETNGVITELLMLVVDAKEFTLISFIGNIDLNKISKLAKGTKIDGLEHLKDLKDKKN
jgi:vacuolar-type H+-ATPase subunit F/Vma7